MKDPRFKWNDQFNYTNGELELIEKINNFLTRPLSPRWIYYGLFDEPDAKQQSVLSGVLNKARKDIDQLINRDMVTDDTRKPIIWSRYKDLSTFISKLSYTRDIWQAQPTYLEVWMEDQASLEAIKKSPKTILQEYRINARYCKGFNSIGAMWEAKKYFESFDKPVRILYYGDLNPSGWAIPVIIVRQFREMGLDIELVRLALNPKQLAEYNIPEFTKVSGDPRRKEFNIKFGFKAWEDEPKQPYKDGRTGKIKHGKKHLNIDLEKIPIEDFERMLERDIRINIDYPAFLHSCHLEQEEDIELDELKMRKSE